MSNSVDLHIFTHYLPIGKHGHVALKRAYFAACRDFMGTEWKTALQRLAETGYVVMTEHDSHGETVDFFTAVIISRHNAKPIDGYIEVLNG